jgi:hypothetical protein
LLLLEQDEAPYLLRDLKVSLLLILEQDEFNYLDELVFEMWNFKFHNNEKIDA